METNPTLSKQWRNYVKQWNKEKFGEEECLGCDCKDTLAQAKCYISRSVKEYLEDHDATRNIELPIRRKGSVKGDTDLQKLIALIENTEQELLPPEDRGRLCSLVFDAYNIAHGSEGLSDILGQFVQWEAA